MSSELPALGSNVPGSNVTVGCDVVALHEIRESENAFGERFLRRVFTDQEIAYCSGPDHTARLAARFAAKEAVIKALTLTDVATPLREIEVVGDEMGIPRLMLHGSMARLAAQQGWMNVSVSLSHTDCHAMAVVAAAVNIDHAATGA